MRFISYCFTFLTITQPLLCMEPITLIKDIIVSNLIHLSHDEVCAWALVNTDYNKIITDTVELRKKYLKDCAVSKGPPIIDELVTWHKNGSAYTLVEQKKTSKKEDKHKPTFKLIYLAHNGRATETSYTHNDNAHPYTIDYQFHPFFDTQGNACLHVYSAINIPRHWLSRDLLHYSLNTKKSPIISRCLLDIPDKNNEFIGFFRFQYFHSLLHAFLQSTHVCQELRVLDPNNSIKFITKIYSITGVTIPDDYQSYNSVRCWVTAIESFNDLSDIVKNVIIKQHSRIS